MVPGGVQIGYYISSLKEWSSIGKAVQGSGRVTVTVDAEEVCRYGTEGCGLAGMMVMGQWFD